MRTPLALAFLFVAAPALAQPTFGIKAGLNVSNFYGFDEGDLDGADRSPALGLVAGVMAQLPLSPSVAVRPEVVYTQKGFRLTDDTGVGELVADYSVDYVEVPVLLRIGIPVSPFADAGLLLGPAFAFEVDESLDAELDGEPVPEENLEFEGDAFKSFDVGAVLGAEFGSGPFGVEARYTYGLLDINENAEDDPTAPTVRNGVFSITGSFRFGQ